MERNAEIALRSGVLTDLQGRNGDLFVIAGENAPCIKPQVTITGRIVRR